MPQAGLIHLIDPLIKSLAEVLSELQPLYSANMTTTKSSVLIDLSQQIAKQMALNSSFVLTFRSNASPGAQTALSSTEGIRERADLKSLSIKTLEHVLGDGFKKKIAGPDFLRTDFGMKG